MVVAFICNFIFGSGSSAQNSTYNDKYMNFSYPHDWKIFNEGNNTPGLVMLNATGANKVFVTSKEHMGNGKNTMVEQELITEDNGGKYCGNHTIEGTNVSYDLYHNGGTFFYFIPKGSKFFMISDCGTGASKDGIELILKTIQ